MNQKADQNAQQIGQAISSGAEELFSGRAKWVQTWISSRGLPFIAQLGLALGYYNLSSEHFQLSDATKYWLAILLFVVVLVRIAARVGRVSFTEYFGGYQTTLIFIAGLLFLSTIADDQRDLYWLFLCLGCWSMGWLYARQCLEPGEFGVLAVLVALLVGIDTPPLPSWIFIAIVFVPVIGWLQWKHNQTKAVLVLSALVVLVWMGAEIEGPLIALAIVATLGFLWLAIFAIGRLARNDMSSFVYSLGVGVISGLVFFVVVKLVGLDSESPLTWWAMTLLYAGIAWILYQRNGESLLSMLFLWAVHWSTISSFVTWVEVTDSVTDAEDYGYHLVLLLGAIALRYLAIARGEQRLYTWAKLYMAVNALFAANWYAEDEATLVRLLFMLSVFATALWFARPLALTRPLAWWRGLISPRHVVAVRRIARKSGKYIVSIPFIGPTVNAVINGLKILSHLKKGNEKVDSGDLLLIFWSICMASFCSLYTATYVFDESFFRMILQANYDFQQLADPDEIAVWISSASDVMATSVSLILAASFLALISIVHRQPIYEFLSMAAFVVAPITLIGADFEGTAMFWLASIVAGGGVLAVRVLGSRA